MPAEPGLVVDSSVFASIFLREDGFRRRAAELAEVEHVRAAPFFRFEVANALWKQRHWPEREVERALGTLFALPIDVGFGAEDARRTTKLARRFGYTFYDMAFVALALREHLPLWTLDQRQAAIARELGLACRSGD